MIQDDMHATFNKKNFVVHKTIAYKKGGWFLISKQIFKYNYFQYYQRENFEYLHTLGW